MKKYLEKIFDKAAEKLDYLRNVEITFSVPNNPAHGDLSANVAMLLTKILKRNPKEIAGEIISALSSDNSAIDKIEIAGPGFINFYFTPAFICGVVDEILSEGDTYGKSEKYKGKRANVEFVSANPTGPLTVGHGRNAVVGDTVANMLEWVGYDVDREFYFNNAGRQMRVLGDSVKQRYLEILGHDITFPEEYYQGEYIKDIARELYAGYGDKLINEPPEGLFKRKAEDEIFTNIKNSLHRMGIDFKIFFNENSLYEDGEIDNVLKYFKEKGLSYEKDGAVWFKLSELGTQQDKVIVKSTGEPTYRLPDIAYHLSKFERGYDLMIDVFGSDHNATYPDVLAGIQALGKDPAKVKVLIYQFVTIIEKGEIVKMSTRKANFITLDELTDEVGSDVVRYFFIMRSMSSHLNFDIDLAKKQSDENPVFYLQYAHARICSILKMTAEQQLQSSAANLQLLVTEAEQKLLKKLYEFKEEILLCAELYEPHRMAFYLEELAGLFHRFYTECRIIGSEKKLAEARIALIMAVKIVIRNGLKILGVSAPDKM